MFALFETSVEKRVKKHDITCQLAVPHPAVTTPHIYSSCVGCPNNTFSFLMTFLKNI